MAPITSTSMPTTGSEAAQMNLPKASRISIKDEFERCWPWLRESLGFHSVPTHTKEQVWDRIAARKAFLFPGKECAIVGEFVRWPIGLVDFNYWLQGVKESHGEGLKELLSMHANIERWARARGAHRATGRG